MNYMIIDVREPDEYAVEHVKDAINLPLGRVMRGASELEDVSKDANLIVYCRSGGRASVAEKALEQQGFTNVINGINKEQVEAKLGL